MTRRNYKRYKAIRRELALLHQDMDDTLHEIQQHFFDRDLKGTSCLYQRLKWIIRDIGVREALERELVLPTFIKIDNGYQEVRNYIKDNGECSEHTIIEEYVSMYLTDNYNHNIYEFTWHCKGNDIYVTNIRWNESQLLPCDIKRLIRGEIDVIKNSFIEVYRSTNNQGCVVISYKETGYVTERNYRGAIRTLENHYYL